MATDPNKPHAHLPLHDNPNHCAVKGCGRSWNYVGHQPSLVAAETLLGASEQLPGSRVLEQHERASGTPFVPSQRQEAAPATHTGRPAMHSGSVYVPSGSVRWIMCPELYRPGAQTARRVRCPFTSPLRQDVAEHLKDAHQYGSLQIGFYLRNPWFADEDRKAWTDRTQHLRREATADDANDWSKTANMQGYEFCTHPNGFGPMGCPCGASRPDEDAPVTVRNLDTGQDVLAIECPNCPETFPQDQILTHMREEELADQEDIDAMAELLGIATLPPPDGSPIWGHSIDCPECHNGFIKGNIRRHLQTVHQWTGDQWETWAESVNFLEMSTVPDVLTQAIEADRERLAQVEAFLNPEITMEQIMTDTANANAIDPEELNKAMDAMAPAQLEALLTEWWMGKAEEEVRRTVPKAVEYGATDLRDIGRDLADCMGREVTDEEATELGIFFYLRGKLSRWVDAVKRGDRVSDDTIFDLAVYTRMAQRNRDAGGWPGLPQ